MVTASISFFNRRRPVRPLWYVQGMNQIKVAFKRLNESAIVPKPMSVSAAGLDLHALEAGMLLRGTHTTVRTGIAFEIPEGYEGQVRSRSGLAHKQGVFVLNSPGTIDSDFRGELMIILANLGQNAFSWQVGDRLAQIVFCPIVSCMFVERELSETIRGEGGLGSTGV